MSSSSTLKEPATSAVPPKEDPPAEPAPAKASPDAKAATAAPPKVGTPVKPSLVKAAPAPIGIDSKGKPVMAPSQPSASSLAIMLTPYLRNTRDVSDATQLPKGLELIRSPGKSQIQLRVASLFAHKLKRTFGYVGDIKMSSGEGCETPAQLQIITKIPWPWGPTAHERESSWIIVRVKAFMSKALFSAPARVGSCAFF